MPLLSTIGAAAGRGFGMLAGASAPEGQQEYTSGGSYSWVAPAGVVSISMVCVGAGGGPDPAGAGAAQGGGARIKAVSLNCAKYLGSPVVASFGVYVWIKSTSLKSKKFCAPPEVI